MYFLSIPFRYSSANTRPNDMIAGMPSLSAVAGMAHNVQRVMQDSCGLESFTTLAFSLVYFSIDRDIAPPRRPPEAGDAKGEVMNLPGLMDIRRAHGEAALIVYFSIEDAADYAKLPEMTRLERGQSEVAQALSDSLRFAGGDIFLGLPGEFNNRPLMVEVDQTWDAVVSKMLSAYPTQGLLIEDQSRMIREKCRTDGLDSLNAMTALLFQSKKQSRKEWSRAAAADSAADLGPAPDGAAIGDVPDYTVDDLLALTEVDVEEENEDVDPDLSVQLLGTLIPAAVGFHEVCAPRGDQVFVEAVLSVVKARVLPSVKLDLTQGRASWQSHFWTWEHLPAHRLYRATSFSN